jgi:hypothetical protein
MFRRVVNISTKKFFCHNSQRFSKLPCVTFQKQSHHTFQIPKFSKKVFTIVLLGSLSALTYWYFQKYRTLSAAEEKITHFGDENSPPIYRFVLTGGPCAGKSTALSHIANRLMSMGFLVFMVPEAATLLINGMNGNVIQ